MGIQIDKALINGTDLGLTNTGDFVVVSESLTILQTAQNKCLADVGTWLYDENYGNTLSSYIRQQSVWNLTDDIVKTHIELALKDMIEDGRITEVRHTKILDRQSDSLYIEIGLVIGTQLGTITYEVTNF